MYQWRGTGSGAVHRYIAGLSSRGTRAVHASGGADGPDGAGGETASRRRSQPDDKTVRSPAGWENLAAMHR